MPYIKKEGRARAATNPETPGELNYAITKIILRYLFLQGDPKYATFNDVIGVLGCIHSELYRRMVAPYENLKISENGDVYGDGNPNNWNYKLATRLNSDVAEATGVEERC